LIFVAHWGAPFRPSKNFLQNTHATTSPCSFSPRWNRNGRASAVEDHQIFLERFAKVEQGQDRRHGRRGRSSSRSGGFRETEKSA
jgi:hypothetical protein